MSNLEHRRLLAVLALVGALAGCAPQYKQAARAECTSALIVQPVRDLRAGEQAHPNEHIGKVEGTVRDCRSVPVTAITVVVTSPAMAGWRVGITDDLGYFSLDVPADEDSPIELSFYRKCTRVPSSLRRCKERPVLALTEVKPTRRKVLPLEVVLSEE